MVDLEYRINIVGQLFNKIIVSSVTIIKMEFY
jgi:hypothetical protein